MALIKCSECGKQVSEKASACPKCGAPIAIAATNGSSSTNTTRAGAKLEGMGFVIVVVGMLVGMVDNPFISHVGGVAFVVGFVVFIVGRFK
jgi:hypothetical protein